MKQQLYIAIGAAALLGLYTWWIYGLGQDSIEAKVITVTVTEEARQGDAAGKLAVGDIKREQHVKEVVDESKKTRAPQDCDLADIGDLRYDALRVRNEISSRSHRAASD